MTRLIIERRVVTSDRVMSRLLIPLRIKHWISMPSLRLD